MFDWLFGPSRVEQKLDKLLERFWFMSSQLDALTAQVAASTTVEASAVTLIAGLAGEVQKISAELAASGSDTTKLDALATQMKASSDALAAAVSANVVPTPAV